MAHSEFPGSPGRAPCPLHGGDRRPGRPGAPSSGIGGPARGPHCGVDPPPSGISGDGPGHAPDPGCHDPDGDARGNPASAGDHQLSLGGGDPPGLAPERGGRGHDRLPDPVHHHGRGPHPEWHFNGWDRCCSRGGCRRAGPGRRASKRCGSVGSGIHRSQHCGSPRGFGHWWPGNLVPGLTPGSLPPYRHHPRFHGGVRRIWDIPCGRPGP